MKDTTTVFVEVTDITTGISAYVEELQFPDIDSYCDYMTANYPGAEKHDEGIWGAPDYFDASTNYCFNACIGED